jgi:hypothetical protein
MQISSIPEQKFFNGLVFPLTLIADKVDDQCCNKFSFLHHWIGHNKDHLDDLLRKHKAILFRNFDIKNFNDFDSIIKESGYNGMPYLGGAAVRTQLTERVFTANESPSSEIIPFHHEMAQTPHPPTHLFFYCEVPPPDGGEVNNNLFHIYSYFLHFCIQFI